MTSNLTTLVVLTSIRNGLHLHTLWPRGALRSQGYCSNSIGMGSWTPQLCFSIHATAEEIDFLRRTYRNNFPSAKNKAATMVLESNFVSSMAYLCIATFIGMKK